MFSIYKLARDAQGREVIELGMDDKRGKAVLMAAPIVFVLAMYFVMDMPLIMAAVMLVFLLAAFAVIGFPALASIAGMSMLRITLDSKSGRILVENAAGPSEIRMAEVARAEFGSSISSTTSSDGSSAETTVYRLEFVMKNGERVPATAGYTNSYSLADQEKMVAAINAALGRQMV
jgi:hypothetical protein